MPLKQIQNSTLFGEIQPSTIAFIAYLTRFRLISHPFKNPHRIPTDPWGFITVPIPIPYPHLSESPWESPHPRQAWVEMPTFLFLWMHHANWVPQHLLFPTPATFLHDLSEILVSLPSQQHKC